MTGARTRGWQPTVVVLAIVSAVVVGGIGAVRAAGQAPSPTGQTPVFRGGVTLVELSALVTDDRQQPYTDLTIDDFEVLEAGQPRPLVSVRYLSTRTTAPAAMPVALPGRAEQIVGNDTADAPAFVLLLDDLNVSPYDAHRAIRAGLGVVEAVPGSALLSVLTTSGDGNGLLTLTPPNDDHAALVRAFRGRFMLSGPPPNPNAPQTTSSSVDAPCGVGSAVDTSPDCVDPTRAARRAAAVEAVGRLLSRAGSRRKVRFWLTTDLGVGPPGGDPHLEYCYCAAASAASTSFAAFAMAVFASIWPLIKGAMPAES